MQKWFKAGGEVWATGATRKAGAQVVASGECLLGFSVDHRFRRVILRMSLSWKISKRNKRTRAESVDQYEPSSDGKVLEGEPPSILFFESCLLFLHPLSILCPSLVHLWYSFGASLVHLLSIIGPSLVPLWYSFCPSFVHLLSIFCPSVVHLWFIFGPSFVPVPLYLQTILFLNRDPTLWGGSSWFRQAYGEPSGLTKWSDWRSSSPYVQSLRIRVSY